LRERSLTGRERQQAGQGDCRDSCMHLILTASG
jgi:hypothetical protein